METYTKYTLLCAFESKKVVGKLHTPYDIGLYNYIGLISHPSSHQIPWAPPACRLVLVRCISGFRSWITLVTGHWFKGGKGWDGHDPNPQKNMLYFYLKKKVFSKKKNAEHHPHIVKQSETRAIGQKIYSYVDNSLWHCSFQKEKEKKQTKKTLITQALSLTLKINKGKHQNSPHTLAPTSLNPDIFGSHGTFLRGGNIVPAGIQGFEKTPWRFQLLCHPSWQLANPPSKHTNTFFAQQKGGSKVAGVSRYIWVFFWITRKQRLPILVAVFHPPFFGSVQLKVSFSNNQLMAVLLSRGKSGTGLEVLEMWWWNFGALENLEVFFFFLKKNGIKIQVLGTGNGFFQVMNVFCQDCFTIQRLPCLFTTSLPWESIHNSFFRHHLLIFADLFFIVIYCLLNIFNELPQLRCSKNPSKWPDAWYLCSHFQKYIEVGVQQHVSSDQNPYVTFHEILAGL